MTNKTKSSSYENMQTQNHKLNSSDIPTTETPTTETPTTETPTTETKTTTTDSDLDTNTATAAVSNDLKPNTTATQLQDLQETVTKLTQELRDTKLRNMAEIKNLQDRYQREQDIIKKYAHQYFARDVIDTVDALEQAQQNTTGEQQQAIALIASMLEKTLIKHQIEPIDPINQPFDHNLHEVMTTIPNTETANDQIVQVIQKGYKIKDRLLRPARVIIAKNTPVEAKED